MYVEQYRGNPDNNVFTWVFLKLLITLFMLHMDVSLTDLNVSFPNFPDLLQMCFGAVLYPKVTLDCKLSYQQITWL